MEHDTSSDDERDKLLRLKGIKDFSYLFLFLMVYLLPENRILN